VVNPYANTPGEDRQGPLAITFDLPEGLAAGPVGKPSEGYSSGKTLGMQLMPGGGEGRFRLVLWTLSNTTWACGTKCPPGITSGRWVGGWVVVVGTALAWVASRGCGCCERAGSCVTRYLS
jgi:hypothetical protein